MRRMEETWEQLVHNLVTGAGIPRGTGESNPPRQPAEATIYRQAACSAFTAAPMIRVSGTSGTTSTE